MDGPLPDPAQRTDARRQIFFRTPIKEMIMAGNDKQTGKPGNMPGQGANQGSNEGGTKGGNLGNQDPRQGSNQSGNQGNNQGGNQGTNQENNQRGSQGGGKTGSSQSDTGGRGFASMDRNKQREIASEGGRAAHAAGTAHEFTSQEAREAGRMSHKNDGNQQSGQGQGNRGGQPGKK
jgi:hypothetical protein